MAKRRAKQAIQLGALGRPVECAVTFDPAGADALGRVWIEVCLEGTYRGHPKFPELNWSKEVFDKIVANFRKHPGYEAGEDGYGKRRLVPWDYEHESEIAKANGRVPAGGLPAASWTHDLEVRVDSKGRTALFALTELLGEARQQIETGGYQFCSVAVLPAYIDPVTGVDQGPTLTSIAFTNDPFIQGMEPIAAKMGTAIRQQLDQYGPAESLLEVLVGLRSAFEMDDEATPQEVLAQVQQFFELLAADAVPEYVEDSYLLDRVRRLLKLPLLATPDQILGGAEEALNRLINGESSAGLPATPTETPEMALIASLTAIASILGCAETEPAILQAATITKKKADDAAAATQAAESAVDSIAKLKEMFGSSDLTDLITKATKAIADAEAMKGAVESLKAAQEALKANATGEAEAEAEAVAASMTQGNSELHKRLLPGILASRTACINADGTVDQAKLAKFREDFPLPEEQKALLTRRVVAGPNGTQLGGPATGYGTQVITQNAGGAGKPSAEIQKVIDAVNIADGRNHVERTNSYLCSVSAAHKALPLRDQIRKAGDFSRSLMAGKLQALAQ